VILPVLLKVDVPLGVAEIGEPTIPVAGDLRCAKILLMKLFYWCQDPPLSKYSNRKMG